MGNYTYLDEHLVMYRVVKLLCCMSETNVKLYIHYISIINL